MHAEILAIGTELTTGAKLDTNSQWLSIELAAVGIPVLLHTTVSDDMPAMLETLLAAVRRSDIVLVSGGLGPTLDDLTRQALADLAGVELVLHEPSLQYIRELFAKRKRIMPERNVIQAMFPAGSDPIENSHGSAPGVWMELPRPNGDRCLIAAMPGVPSEMKPMFRDSVLPRLPHSNKIIRRARVNCYGVGESACEEKLGDVTARGRDPEVGITVHEGTITLRIEAHGATESECDTKIDVTKQLIHERLGELVFGEEDEQLEDVVVCELNRRGQTVAVADEVTGGVLSLWLTAATDSERCFLGGAIGSPAGRRDDQPLEHARQLAQQTRERFGADFALAIAGSLKTQGIPRLGLALADAHGVEFQEHIPVADVSFARNRAAKSTLDLLRLRLAQP
ncbi:MAG: CinA family nicotinamide mononucleotide deamidase-related protein [Planctomycetaceae bacterium]|nr:CinA family nicotinamide mononucleotide deamidase-related protein [Planctomycetaceae bacterium]